MRIDAPHGGRQDGMIDLQQAGYMSTGALSAKLGLGGSIPTSFIVDQLGIQPRMKGPTGNGYYWAPEQLGQIRRALITRLLAQEFGEAAC